MKYLLNALLIFALAAVTIQCEVVSEDLLDNPNAPSPESASPDFIFNDIQLGVGGSFGNFENEGADLVRMEHLFATTYPNAFQPQFFDSEWNAAYSGMLIDIQTLIPLAQERTLTIHEGASRIIKAYVLFNLVDRFGPVPLSEALNANNFNPNVDTQEDVYAAAMAELDTARTVLSQQALGTPSDDIYFGDAADQAAQRQAWIRLANTLELRALITQRQVNAQGTRINTLLNGANGGPNDVIDEPGEEWVFRYGTNNSNPDTRHPDFANNYVTGAAGGAYMANYFMNELLQDYEDGGGNRIPDPRIRYYLYRQVDAPTTDVNEQQCITNAPPVHYEGTSGNGRGNNDPFCEDWNDLGYWGRDHGFNAGIPPDNFKRTTYGVYPAGGNFDANQATAAGGNAPVNDGMGLQGAGIRPMWMPFYTDYLRAEYELTLGGGPGAAKTALEDAIKNSIDFLRTFGRGTNPGGVDVIAKAGGAAFEPSNDDRDDYVAAVEDRWMNQATSTQDRLDMIGKEYWKALWGNGIEAYSLYRRIAPPRQSTFWDMQPNRESASPGQFWNTFFYPSAFFERNSNVNQKPNPGGQERPFWMTADAGFANF